MNAVAKEKNLPFRKTYNLFEAKIDALNKAILDGAKAEMTDHIKMMMREAFSSNGKAALFS